MKATGGAAVLVAACIACCAPLIAGAAAVVAPPVLLAGGAAVAVGTGLAGLARRRRTVAEPDAPASVDARDTAGRDTTT